MAASHERQTPDAYQDYIARKRASERKTKTVEIPSRERYGMPVPAPGEKPPRPRVYSTTNGFRIEPWYYSKGQGTDNMDVAIESEYPPLLEIFVFITALCPPLYLVLKHFLDKKYERQFWIKNGFDPDTFITYS